jgi:hypothetical protein
MRVTENFDRDSDNMTCPCCGGFPDMADIMPFMKRIQILRDFIGLPFKVDPGGFYRCRDYQKKHHPENPDSQHCLGKAIDFSYRGWSGKDVRRLIKLALELELSVIIYSTWFHVDMRVGEPILLRGKV